MTVVFVVLVMKVGDKPTDGHNDYNTFHFLRSKRNVEDKSVQDHFHGGEKLMGQNTI